MKPLEALVLFIILACLFSMFGQMLLALFTYLSEN